MMKPKSKTKQRPIPASDILRAEAARLCVLQHALPEKALPLVRSQMWAFDMAAAYLESLGAPEKLVRYFPEK